MNTHSRISRQSGFGIVELMISLVITLVLTTVVANVFLATKTTYRLQDNLARIQENGRYAIDVMGRYVRIAGFRSNPGIPSATVFPNPYATIGAAGLNEVTIRHFGSGPTGTPDNSIKDCAGNARDGDARIMHRFYLNGGNLICDTSYEDTASGTPNATIGATSVMLAENVESLTALFGVDTDADTSANYYVDFTNMTATTWPQVVTVQLCIVVKSKDTNLTVGSQSYRDCDLTTKTPSDGFFHRPFRTTINLRNPQSVL